MNSQHIIRILESLSEKKDPFYGEEFDGVVLLEEGVLNALKKLLDTIQIESDRIYSYWPVEEIYEELRAWRNDEARLREVPPYVIFHNSHLTSISKTPILEKEELLNIPGIGPRKYEEYGDLIFDILKPYIERWRGSISAQEKDAEPDPEDQKLADELKEFESESEAQRSAITCRKCMLYRREDCLGNGDPTTCEDFVPAPDVPTEELQRWKTLQGTATHIRLTGHGFREDR